MNASVGSWRGGLAPGARDAARSLLRSAARGAGLIAGAVVIGIVLLQIVDDGSTGPAGDGGGNGAGSNGNGTTETSAPDGTQPDDGGQARPPAQVRVLVLNGSGVAGAAQNETNRLRTAGYQTLTPNNAAQRTGNAVQCKNGFDADADALVLAIGPGTVVEPYQPPPNVGAENADCVVILGAAQQ